MWRYVGGTPKAPETAAEVAEAKPQPEQKPEPAPDERRRHPRAKVNLLACLSTNGLEDIVQCEDVSRGGFCFVSEMCYPVGLNTEAAMPYSKTGGNIFVPSRIAHSRELPDGHFRHGVAYKPTRQ